MLERFLRLLQKPLSREDIAKQLREDLSTPPGKRTHEQLARLGRASAIVLEANSEGGEFIFSLEEVVDMMLRDENKE